MKQVTMESVKQRIADLESAGKVVGGLSLSSEFELGCLRELVAVTEQRDALVVENVGLLRFGDKLNDMRNNLNGEGTGIQGRAEVACQQIALESAMEEFDAIKTPATSSAIAALRAEVVSPRIQEQDLKALLRFNETCEDGEGYDIGIDAMNRLVEIGLCSKGHGGIRHITPFGQWVIDAQEGEIDSTPLRTESDVNADFSEHLARQLRESKGANHA